MKIPILNKAGAPQAWIDFEQAAVIASKDMVLWAMGEMASVLRGGYLVAGQYSTITPNYCSFQIE